MSDGMDPQGPESDSPPSRTPVDPLNFYPNDIAIVSVEDARRRLEIADGIGADLDQLTAELQRLLRHALEAAGTFEVDALYDGDRMEALLTNTPPPPEWGDNWVIDHIWLGNLADHPRCRQALSRVSAYVGIPSADVRELVLRINDSIESMLVPRARDLLPRIRTVIGAVHSASGEYQHFRDSVAGRLDRMEAEQETGRRIGNVQPKRGSQPADAEAQTVPTGGERESPPTSGRAKTPDDFPGLHPLLQLRETLLDIFATAPLNGPRLPVESPYWSGYGADPATRHRTFVERKTALLDDAVVRIGVDGDWPKLGIAADALRSLVQQAIWYLSPGGLADTANSTPVRDRVATANAPLTTLRPYFVIIERLHSAQTTTVQPEREDWGPFKPVKWWTERLVISDDTFARRRRDGTYREHPKSQRGKLSISLADLTPDERKAVNEATTRTPPRTLPQ